MSIRPSSTVLVQANGHLLTQNNSQIFETFVAVETRSGASIDHAGTINSLRNDGIGILLGGGSTLVIQSSGLIETLGSGNSLPFQNLSAGIAAAGNNTAISVNGVVRSGGSNAPAITTSSRSLFGPVTYSSAISVGATGIVTTSGTASTAIALSGGSSLSVAGSVSASGASSSAVTYKAGPAAGLSLEVLAGGSITASQAPAITGGGADVSLSIAGNVQTHATGQAAILLGSGNDRVTLVTGATVTGTVDAGAGADSVALSGTGAGALGATANIETLVVNSGSWTLTGAHNYAGGAFVDGGVLIANEALSSPVTISNGATLSGSGSFGSVTLNGGILSPGNSPGTLTVNGDLTFNAASTYRVEVQSAVADRTNVTGIATLAGTLQFVPRGGPYNFNTPYVILSANGGLNGTRFVDEQLPIGGFGIAVRPIVSYGTNDVTLTLTLTALPASILTNPGNVSLAINQAVAGGGNANPFFPLFNQSAANLPAALTSLSGEVHAAVDSIGIESDDQFMHVMLDPFAAQGRTGNVGTASLWASPFGLNRHVDGDTASTGSANLKLNSANIAMGGDLHLGDNALIGVAGAWGGANIDLSDARGRIEADVLQLGAYALYQTHAIRLGAAVSHALLDIMTNRTIGLFGNAEMRADYDAHSWSVRVEGDARLARLNVIELRGIGAYRHISVDTDATTEAASSNAFAALRVDGRTAKSSKLELGLRLGTLDAARPRLAAYVQFGWAHEFEPSARATAALVGLSGASFTVHGAQPGEDSALVRSGVNYMVTQNWSLGARVVGEIASRTGYVGGSLQARLRF